jgi:branched-chain amino acid transport system permease protein
MQLLIAIILTTCIYSIIGAGFVTIYKASRVLNFAYSEIAMLIAYITATCMRFIGGPVILNISLLIFFSFMFGLIIYKLFIRPMVGELRVSIIILTVALGIIINAVVTLLWKGEIEIISLGWDIYYSLPAGIHISGKEIIVVVSTIVLFLTLAIFYNFTTIGRQMRATSENLLLSAQRGIDIYLTIGIAWGIGILITGLGGIFLGALTGVSLTMGAVMVRGIAVALVGGLDSLKGIIPGAFIIALTEKLIHYYGNPRLGDTVPFFVLLIILIFRPWGLWGTEEEIERV